MNYLLLVSARKSKKKKQNRKFNIRANLNTRSIIRLQIQVELKCNTVPATNCDDWFLFSISIFDLSNSIYCNDMLYLAYV